ncbi:transposase [Microbacterium sp. WCS2018Hpa-9]|uniref:transposase n=1 Tax=Microbacterium sp. WCS2018Hpa-9 TaxID=3073635 RepID=UPI0037C96FC7
MGRSRGGLTTKNHLVCDGKGRALAFVLTPGQTADTSMLIDTLSEIRVLGRTGRPRTRPDRLLAHKGYPSKANRAWLRELDIAATIPERDDQIATAAGAPADPSTLGVNRGSATRAATLSNAASPSSGSGAASRCAQTRLPATTTPVSASPRLSNGPRRVNITHQ